MASQPTEQLLPPITKKTIRKTAPVKPREPVSAYASRSESAKSRSGRSGFPVGAVIGLIVVLILIAGAYFGVMYFKNKAAEEAAAREAEAAAAAQAAADAEAAAQAQASADPTVNWQTFSLPDKTADMPATILSFKYPTELQLTQNSNNLLLSSTGASTTQVMVNWVKSSKTLKEYLSALDKVNAEGWEGQPSVSITTSTDAVVVSGQPAVFRQQTLLAADLQQYIVYAKSADTVYAISLAAPQLDQNLLGFFVAFVNNFKFGQ